MEHGTYRVNETGNRVSDEYEVRIRLGMHGTQEILKIKNFYNCEAQGVDLFVIAHKESENHYEIRPQEIKGLGFLGVIYKRSKGDWVMFFTVFQRGEEEHNFASLKPHDIESETTYEGWPKFL